MFFLVLLDYLDVKFGGRSLEINVNQSNGFISHSNEGEILEPSACVIQADNTDNYLFPLIKLLILIMWVGFVPIDLDPKTVLNRASATTQSTT